MSKPKISPKIEFPPKSIFTRISELSAAQNALNLGQGFPSFPCSKALLDLLEKNIRKMSHQYAPSIGLKSLREKIAEKISALYGLDLSVDNEITVVPGATFGVYTSISALVKPGDRVIVMEPYYENYLPCIFLHGGIPEIVPVSGSNMDWEAFDRVFDKSVKAVLINSPHNPSTKVFSSEFYDTLAGRLRDTDTLVISDEVYEHIVFDGREHITIMSHPELRERSVGVFSFGKTYHITGWKMGYLTAAKELTREIRKTLANQIFSINPVHQQTLAEFMEYPEEYLGLRNFYEKKRNLLMNGLNSETLFSALPCEGTFFVLADYSKISEKGDFDFAVEMIERHGISSIPISPFFSRGYDGKVVRFCFAHEDKKIIEAVKILSEIR